MQRKLDEGVVGPAMLELESGLLVRQVPTRLV